MERAEDDSDVSLHRAKADPQVVRDQLVGVTEREQAQHIELARRQDQPGDAPRRTTCLADFDLVFAGNAP